MDGSMSRSIVQRRVNVNDECVSEKEWNERVECVSERNETDASIAQSVEHSLSKRKVGSSILP